MSQRVKKNRYSGVSFEPEVSEYLDELAGRMRMSRSRALNTIAHKYARFIRVKI